MGLDEPVAQDGIGRQGTGRDDVDLAVDLAVDPGGGDPAGTGRARGRVRLLIRYDGTRYYGWQRQRDQPTIQGEVERSIAEITRSQTPIYGSGRTDAGVHAFAQVAHFDSDTAIPMGSLPRALNAKLPHDIAVSAAERVSDGFHARFSARRKTYIYRMFVAAERDPLRERFAYRITRRPDLAAMRSAARTLVGQHDFRSFVTGGAGRDDTVREVGALRVLARGDSVLIVATASGFLQHMVRNLSGLLLRVGDGRIAPGAVSEILAARERSAAPAALAAAGLLLWRVDY